MKKVRDAIARRLVLKNASRRNASDLAGVLQVVALVLQGVEPFILDLPTRPRGAHQLHDVVGGGRSVTQLRYFTSPSLMIRNWMKLIAGSRDCRSAADR